jgi:hypothetical protein
MAHPTEVNYERKEIDFEEQGEAATMASRGGTPSTRLIDGAERGMLRKFSPAFLNALDFIQDVEGEPTACGRLAVLKELNADGWRRLPADVPY